MRIFGLRLTGLITLSLMMVAPSARAQQGGMGLDLSDTSQSDSNENQETPAAGEEQSGGIGLDLSGETVNSELLPHVVLLGLDTPERAGAAVAVRWLKGLYLSARSNDQWVLSSPLKEVREKLGDNYAAALRCAEASCLAEPAETLEADLLVTARLALEDEGWTFRLWTYDRDHNKVEMDVVTGRSPKDVKFQKAGADLLAQRLKGLARQRAMLSVKVNVPQAVVRLGEKTLGVGSIERRVPPGEAELIVEADEFTPYKKTVTLKPGEKSSVEAYLESSGPAPDSPTELVAEATKKQEKPSAPTVFSRPALYTAVVGVLAMGAGVMVGMQAKKVANRAPDADGNGIADITRKERIDAQNQANLATALTAGGAAVAGGSVLWLVLMPTRSEAPKSVAPVVAPGGASSATPSTALHLILGGSF
ncbi:MAG: PEGA domain-containing protein [Hyalangium sp.]|uniref:PEGA domain-containing protein n=1 Tax=Hyalangium sp. TaxID=2028555 RepID=UPI00389A494B